MHPHNNPPTRCLTQSPHRSSASWTREDDKKFEQALVFFPPEEFQNRWQRIGVFVGKTAMEVKEHYDILMHDLSEIESGRIELPNYKAEDAVFFSERKAKREALGKKYARWTDEEKERFLIGLKIYGKGAWKRISENVVITKTPKQVASHADNYYLQQFSANYERRRASIIDITSVDTKTVAPSSEDHWITPPDPPTDHGGAPI